MSHAAIGDALTAIPLGLAFFFRSARGERWESWRTISTTDPGEMLDEH